MCNISQFTKKTTNYLKSTLLKWFFPPFITFNVDIFELTKGRLNSNQNYYKNKNNYQNKNNYEQNYYENNFDEKKDYVQPGRYLPTRWYLLQHLR